MKVFIIYSIVHVVVCNGVSYVTTDVASKSEADTQCLNKSGLVKYTEIIYKWSFDNLEPDTIEPIGLQNGQNAWIDGTVKFTDSALYFHGCARLRQNITTFPETFEHGDFALYRCVERCEKFKDVKFSFVGIGQNSNNYICYCIRGADNFDIEPPSTCTHYIPNVSSRTTTQVNTPILSVYRIIDDDWLKKTTSSRECLTAKVSTNGTIIHEEVSCNANATSLDIGGFVCWAFTHSHLNNQTCTFRNNSNCLVLESANLTVARSHCHNIPGWRLLSRFSEETVESLQISQGSNSFLVGLFRPFTVTNSSYNLTDKHMICLSVIRVGTRLYLEPDNCQLEKPYICASDTMDTNTIAKTEQGTTQNYQETTTQSTSIDDEGTTQKTDLNSTPSISIESTQNNDKRNDTRADQEEAENDTDYLKVFVYIGSGILIVIIIVICICYKIRKMHRERLETSEDNSKKEQETIPKQVDQSPLAVSYQVNGTNRNSENVSSNIYSEPIMIEDVKSSNDYDHICFRESKKACLNKKSDDGHLYGFPKVADMDNDYDVLNSHITAKNTFKNAKPRIDDNVYGYPEGMKPSDDYDTLNSHGTSTRHPSQQYGFVKSAIKLNDNPKGPSISNDYDVTSC